MGGLGRGGMMVTIVAAALVLAALVTQGCGRAAPPAPPGGVSPAPTPPDTTSPGAVTPPASPPTPGMPPGWVEEPYDWDKQEEGIWCQRGARFSALAKCSPSGEWEVHPTNDGYGAMCLVNRQLGLHQVWFRYTKALSPSELEGAMGRGLPWRPEPCFWAGDGSGVYLVYRSRQRFFFVTAPDGAVARLDIDLSDKHIFGSPPATRDLVVLRSIRDEANSKRISRYRLCLFDPDGRELRCLDEIDVYWETQWVRTYATHQAFMLAFDFRDPKEWQTTFHQVRVYRPGSGGTWAASTYANVASPALRGDCLTLVEERDGWPWVKQISPAGAQEWLFPVPEVVARNHGDSQCWWDDRGQCLFFGEWEVLVRAVD